MIVAIPTELVFNGITLALALCTVQRPLTVDASLRNLPGALGHVVWQFQSLLTFQASRLIFPHTQVLNASMDWWHGAWTDSADHKGSARGSFTITPPLLANLEDHLGIDEVTKFTRKRYQTQIAWSTMLQCQLRITSGHIVAQNGSTRLVECALRKAAETPMCVFRNNSLVTAGLRISRNSRR
jgi:hypothetical protein